MLLPRRALLLLAAAVLAAAVDAQPPPPLSRTDAAGLYSVRASLGLRARDWPVKSDPCTSWTGVVCRAGRVVSLTVAGLRRTRVAALSPRFALDGLRNLTALERFNASGFALPGEIPAWFGGGALPPSLSVLDLSSAAVNGTLPADLGANLTTLLLAGNNLSGAVPSALLSAGSIRVLDLSRNNFSGALPTVPTLAAGDGAGAASSSLLNISGNALYGVAGDAIRRLRRKFQVIDVSSNYLDGAWNGSDGAVLATTNCFYGVPGQRRRADCEEFYNSHGVRLVYAPAPAPSPKPLPTPVPEKTDKKQGISRNLLIGVLVAAGALMILFSVALLFCLFGRSTRGGRAGGRGVEPNEEGTRSGRRRDSSVNPVTSSPSALSPRASAAAPKVDTPSVPGGGELPFEQLVHATGGFGDGNLLKRGHSGDIYHGVIPETGAHVVVKKVGAKSLLRPASELDFYKRYPTHERIVPLLAHFARDDGEEVLAYKYMPKGDLTQALHKKPGEEVEEDGDGLPSLDWITRLKIAIGVAEAMCFLHDECSPPMVHRDIQASSVLLDDKFEVRLGSMSDVCPQQSGGSQNVFSRMLRSSKSLEKHTSGPPATCSYDVHCFGKLLLELVTGNLSISGPSTSEESSEWLTTTLNHINAGDKSSITDIVDPLLLVDEDHLEEVWAVAIIAKTCLNAKPSRRPSARYVLRALENPLRVVRRSSSARQLRSSSSRSSWQSVFQGTGGGGAGRVQSLDGRALDRRHSARSFGSGGGGGASFSFGRAPPTPDIVQETSAGREEVDDGVV